MAVLEKFLRRLKIWALKTENLLSRWIKNLKEKSHHLTQKSRQLIEQKRIKTKIWPNISREKTDYFQVKKDEKIFSGETLPADSDSSSLSQESSQISIADLEKPIKEEQQWIDLIIQNPKNKIAYKELGMLYFKQHNYADAKESLEAAIKLGSKDKKVKEILEELKRMEKQKKTEDEPACLAEPRRTNSMTE